MGSISDYLENKLLDHVFNLTYTPAATVYLALYESNPGDGGGGTETSYTGYARQAITFGAAASRRVTQSGAVTFGMNTGSSVTITHWGIKDAASSGNLLAHGSFASSVIVATNNTPSVGSGQIYVEVLAGYASNYLANAWLDRAFRNQAFATPLSYIALTTATISDSSTGSTITEVANSNGYSRARVYPYSGSAPKWSLAVSGQIYNQDNITLGPPTGSWGTIVAMAIVDSATHGAGNLLYYDNSVVDQTVNNGDVVRFLAGDVVLTLS